VLVAAHALTNVATRRKAERGRGFGQAAAADARRSVECLAAVSQIQEGGGSAQRDLRRVRAAVWRLRRSLEPSRHLDEIAGEGLHSLIYDAPTEQDLVIEALEAGARMNSILAKIDRGDGTLGMIVNDPTLYEDLKLLVGGANRSRVVRTLIACRAREP
jgi:phospholipid/cholesterol/gamma-HCH transport system substrate-binding protein